jgi:sensor c-di-GMP phosphodiesterase-like protein
VNYSTRETIIYSGGATFPWAEAQMPADAQAGTLVMGDHLLAWRRSSQWDQFSYAAVPVAAITQKFESVLGYFIAGGSLLGLALVMLVRRFAANRMSLPALLSAGLARKEVYTVYQPIVDMRTGRWVGAEVLARWRRPTGEVIAPDVFVPMAEKHGLIRQLTRHVMISCAEDLRKLVRFDPDFFVSVNVTATDLEDPNFVTQLIAECDARGVAHHRVHLEITERAEVDPVRAQQGIVLLQEQGFKIGIDDFGVGFSNLAYLDTLKVDYLKIDRAFVAGILRSATGSTLADVIIQLGTARGLEIIAEGVELEAQRLALVARGVWLGQGWLFSKPLSAEDLEVAYSRHRSSPQDEDRAA